MKRRQSLGASSNLAPLTFMQGNHTSNFPSPDSDFIPSFSVVYLRASSMYVVVVQRPARHSVKSGLDNLHAPERVRR